MMRGHSLAKGDRGRSNAGGRGRGVALVRAFRLRRGLPLATLLLALSSVFWFGGATGHLHGNHANVWLTGKQMARAENLEFASGLRFHEMNRDADGAIRKDVYHRFPIGGTALIKLAIWPFEGDLSAQLAAARTLMLAFFCAAALLAYAALSRLVGSRPIALAATLLAFASYYMLAYNDMVSTEIGMDIFGVLLVFHAMVLFQGRAAGALREDAGSTKRCFWWLLATVCVALLLGWHVFALLAPFLALGLAGEARAAWRHHSPAAGQRLAARFGAAALAMLHSRITLLAVCSVLFGAFMVGCNLAIEHAHLAATTQERGAEEIGVGDALARLPTWRSIHKRTGLRGGIGGFVHGVRWDPFLKWQFHRVGMMVAPAAAAGVGRFALADEWEWRGAGTTTLAGLGVAATAACFAGLLLSGRRLGRRGMPGRGLLAVLALSGFCWTIPMHRNTGWSSHDFEACMYLGLSLVLFTLLGVGVRRVWRGASGAAVPAGAAAAGAALAALVFAGSSCRMAQDGARRTHPAQLAVLAEFQVVRALARGKDVLVAATESETGPRSAIWWYMAGAVLHYAEDLTETARVEARGEVDFVLTFERVAAPLYTPAHRFAFLYDAGGVADAIVAARRRSHAAMAAREPLARGAFDLHLLPLVPQARSSVRGVRGGDLALAYVKHPCRPEDLRGVFFLEVTPANAADLPYLSRRARRDSIYFFFQAQDDFGLFEDKCLFRAPLPAYPVRSIKTGRYAAADLPGWEVGARIDRHALRRARDVVVGAPPAGQGFFDVHLRNRTVTYLRAPCAAADTEDRFFLHVTPARPDALPPGRRPAGFANLDFDFNERGARFNGGCVATRTLPDYEIARLSTGQFDAGGEAGWRVAVSVSPGEAPAGEDASRRRGAP